MCASTAQELLKIIEAKRTHRQPKLEAQELDADPTVVELIERLRASLGGAAGIQATARKEKKPAAVSRPQNIAEEEGGMKVAEPHPCRQARARRTAGMRKVAMVSCPLVLKLFENPFVNACIIRG